MKMRSVLMVFMVIPVLSMLVGCSSSASTVESPTVTVEEFTATAEPVASTEESTAVETTNSDDPLLFPVDNYTEKTVTVTTSLGIQEVTYRLYEHLTYVANPVDVDYQSLDVKVPVSIDGKSVDATNAPILFLINVGGYMSVNNATGGMGVGAPVGGLAGGAMGGGLGDMQGTPPAGMGGNPPVGGGMGGGSSVSDLALAAGYVVVIPGVRGRDNQAADGTYYGKAPAAIVDLKAAVRYIRHNDAVMPGNSEWIISRGTSAGGALSALLGASGNSYEYDAYLTALGAADEDDSIFASADYCPITDLDHADMAYEWEFGTTARNGELVDQNVSQLLAGAFPEYLASLKLQGLAGFGSITADNYGDYLVQSYLIPSANKYLLAMTDDERNAYLADNSWIIWADNSATFTFADYVAHVGRSKNVPAFDNLDLSSAETVLFGTETTNARHFTVFSLQQSSGDAGATVDVGLQTAVNLMNPMYFIAQGNPDMAAYWWIRQGASDTDTALPVFVDLATSLQNQGKDVNALLYWDAGHGADEDPEAFIAWIGEITGK